MIPAMGYDPFTVNNCEAVPATVTGLVCDHAEATPAALMLRICT
jgi:hypothetical protein